jgi:hypothetical protein
MGQAGTSAGNTPGGFRQYPALVYLIPLGGSSSVSGHGVTGWFSLASSLSTIYRSNYPDDTYSGRYADTNFRSMNCAVRAWEMASEEEPDE